MKKTLADWLVAKAQLSDHPIRTLLCWWFALCAAAVCVVTFVVWLIVKLELVHP